MKLRPMSEAPKDREIFAVHLLQDAYGCPRPGVIDWGNFHPIMWKERPWQKDYRPRWGMRWSEEFQCQLNWYGGWFDPKDLRAAISHPNGAEPA